MSNRLSSDATTAAPARPPRTPRVSIIIPAYRSSATLARCLEALAAQTFDDFEVVLVDSSDDDGPDGHRERTRALAAQARVPLTVIAPPHRCLPHEARNIGASQAHGDLLVFTDPDIYPTAGWLQALVQFHAVHDGVAFGPIACEGGRWFDVGVHLCKFAIALPSRQPRTLTYGWSGNMLCSRDAFLRVGGFPAQVWHGDTLISAAFRRDGLALHLAPDALVHHDHERVGAGEFLHERFGRGRELVQLASSGALTGRAWTRAARARRVLTTLVVPVKVLVACTQVGHRAWLAGLFRAFVLTLPVIVAGQAAWVAGASVAVFRNR